MAEPKKKGDADESPSSLPIVDEKPAPRLTGYTLTRNFGSNHGGRSHFWPSGSIFHVGKDDATITLLHQRGAVLAPILE